MNRKFTDDVFAVFTGCDEVARAQLHKLAAFGEALKRGVELIAIVAGSVELLHQLFVCSAPVRKLSYMRDQVGFADGARHKVIIDSDERTRWEHNRETCN